MRIWILVAGLGLVLGGVFGAIGMALPVVSDHGIDFGYSSMDAGGFGGASYDDMDEPGSSSLRAGGPLLMTGFLVSLILGAALASMAFFDVLPGAVPIATVVVALLGATLLILGPVMIGSGANTLTDGAIDSGDGQGGFWLPITGAIIAVLGSLAGGAVALGARFTQASPEGS